MTGDDITAAIVRASDAAFLRDAELFRIIARHNLTRSDLPSIDARDATRREADTLLCWLRSSVAGSDEAVELRRPHHSRLFRNLQRR
jgi:hypothetical protein